MRRSQLPVTACHANFLIAYKPETYISENL